MAAAALGQEHVVIRVALADDHELVRMGPRVLIDREPDMIVTVEVSSGWPCWIC